MGINDINAITGNSIINGSTIFGPPSTTPAGIDFGFVNYFGSSPVLIRDIKVQSDGKILIGGLFSSYSGVSRNNIARLNTDGSLDTSFIVGSGFNLTVFSIAIQNDGKIICTGTFTNYSGTTSNRIIRLNNDGSIDNTFTVGTGFNAGAEVFRVLLQNDGKIICTGSFTTYSGQTRNGIIRLNTNGTIDNTFVIGTGFNSVVRPFQIQTDGKIVCSGNFTSYSGVSYNRIIRLNTDGSIDNTFNVGSGLDANAFDIALQSDNKSILVGNFTTYSGVSRNGIIRLNTNGTIDNTFNVGGGITTNTFGDTFTVGVDSVGKILVGGSDSYKSIPIKKIVRLNPDGSIDYSFSIQGGFGPDGSLLNMRKFTFQNDGKILVGGGFTNYYGFSYPGIIRLNGN